MGTVHHLDDHRPTTPDTEPLVTLVKDPTTGPTTPDAPPTVPPVSRAVCAARALRTAATHERTRTAGRFTVRHGMYVVGGGRIVARRAWEGRTATRYERMLRAAKAAGNLDLATEWEKSGQRFRAARHQRRMDLLSAPVKAAKGAAAGLGITAGGLLLLGIILAVANENFADLATPTLALIELVRWIVLIITVVWGPLVALGPWAALLALWGVGRHQQAAPQWVLPACAADVAAPITPSVVVTALRDLGIGPLRTAVKEMGDAGAAMLGPIRIAGCGVEVDITLPSGVATNEVQKRRRKLAENLARHEHEVFITIPQAARTVRLWIADSGALDEPLGPSPLMTDTTLTADYAKGKAPWGQDLRGDAALISLYQRHMLITGLSNQGKTAALRALALWLALDPRVEFRVADLKGVGDWGMFDGLATVLIQGPTDDHVIEATEMLEDLVKEMERRIQAPSGTVFTPLIGIVDEAQVAFMCPVVDGEKRPYGGSKATSRYFMAARKIHNQGRAVDVLLFQGTQDPTDQNLPKLVREGAHTRASLALGTESQARMALGDKAVDGGAAPNLLRPGLDKGTVVVASDGIRIPAGQAALTVRTHYISTDDAAEIATRAKSLRGGVTTLHAVDRGEERDPLMDVMTVLGDASRVLTTDVLKPLTALSEDTYGKWSHLDLKRVLDGTGAEPYKSHGRMVIDRERLFRHLANRDTDGSASAAE
ncbi:FtsK/SpoIIIE domain-containing protein [Streptomyces castrisilvae]|uniref:FtsK/SpoIIIE domain-containing protein n=1 Tax=Streptomyces castrisilvae TaxID=3033811 RepID=A0ABY9HKG1_9ACTN|nr:FtsK/SpoIIIE domain-containing protein [Streptomyces sp. Mut1]WLQ35018.1 FtsK/SpoIIIE domain-containing protein [Streptomyces sp. Mut1]